MQERIFQPKLESINKIQEFIRENLDKLKCDPGKLLKIDLIIEELVINIIKHGLKTVEKGSISVAINTEHGKAVLKIKDNGIPFNPLKAEDPDINLGLEKRNPGGLGIYMVKKIAKEINYSYQSGQNQITLILDL